MVVLVCSVFYIGRVIFVFFLSSVFSRARTSCTLRERVFVIAASASVSLLYYESVFVNFSFCLLQFVFALQ
jgi:hypothetical protein